MTRKPYTNLPLTFLTEFLLHFLDNAALHGIVVHQEAQFLTYYQNFIVIQPLWKENETNKFHKPWKKELQQSSTNLTINVFLFFSDFLLALVPLRINFVFPSFRYNHMTIHPYDLFTRFRVFHIMQNSQKRTI